MRIVSLLPAATEWLYACGAGADLVGRSHVCDFPPEAAALPVLTRPAFAAEVDALDSKGLDAAVRHTLRQGLSLYEVDLDALRALAPDVLVTQAQCDVCAVSEAHVRAALAAWTGTQPALVSMQPLTFKQALDEALQLARRVGRLREAMDTVAHAEVELARHRRRLGVQRDGSLADGRPRPTVACIEWIEPLMTAAHWMPDLVEHAGGQAVLAEKGHPSREVAWDDLRAADPDVLAFTVCGFSVEATRRDLPYLTRQPGWADLRAVRMGRVHLFDGSAYFNRPGPRLYRAIALLAQVLHPEIAPPDAAPWECQPLALSAPAPAPAKT